MRKKFDAAPWFDARTQEAAAEGAIERGKYDAAAKALEEAEATERSLGWDKMKLFNDNVVLRTRLLLAEGFGDEAAKAFVEYRVVNQEPQPNFLAQLEQALMRSEIDLARGKLVSAAAQSANVRLQHLAGESGVYLRSYDARALLIEGKARLLDHQVPQAVALLQQAVALSRELYDKVQSPALADAEIALSRAYLAAGDRKRASQLRAEARAIHATHRDLGEHYRRPLRDLEARMATHRM
jgi:serine/threonine-protein kinase